MREAIKEEDDRPTGPNNPEQGKSSRKAKGPTSSTSKSLLTEQLRNSRVRSEDNEFECIGEKVIMKSSWIMKEMKRKCSN